MEIFWGCVLEVIIFISPKFEHLWICFDSSIVKISKGCVLVNALDSVSGQHRLNRRLGFKVVGSTGAYKVWLIGFLACLLNAPVLQSSLASDQPVLLVCVLFWLV